MWIGSSLVVQQVKDLALSYYFGSSYCCGAGLIPGPRISVCCGCSPPPKKKILVWIEGKESINYFLDFFTQESFSQQYIILPITLLILYSYVIITVIVIILATLMACVEVPGPGIKPKSQQ